MASFCIHLAIGNKYLENFEVKDKNSFYKGVIAPDLAKDKKLSHYAKNQSKENAYTLFGNKVFLVDYLKSEYDNSDYQIGVFLHLATDYLFFHKFFGEEYLKNLSYEDFSKNLYYSYDVTNTHVETKYNVNYFEFEDVIKNNITQKKDDVLKDTLKLENILPIQKLDEFIEFAASIDLLKYKEKLLKENKNVFP